MRLLFVKSATLAVTVQYEIGTSPVFTGTCAVNNAFQEGFISCLFSIDLSADDK